MNYQEFIDRKSQLGGQHGFVPVWMPDFLFDFQRALVEWAVRRGRAAIFADCGLGKTPMQLVWAENVARKSGGRVLILTPLAVAAQTVREAHKFGMEAEQSRDGKFGEQIVVTNYQQLHKFSRSDFVGCVCDESSILKNFDGELKEQITEFMSKLPYRLLCTATAAPNDYIELGTHSEAVGELERRHMLAQFFTHDGGETSKWRLKGHARTHLFWRWVCTWARACRKPSDMGFNDSGFILPAINIREHVVRASKPLDGFLFDMPAITLEEQRDERRRTLQERCEMAAQLVTGTNAPAVCWCHLNPEGELLERLIPGAINVQGSDSDERKEEVFAAFESGQVRNIITKPTIAGFGLNWQHCAHQTFFPSHSFEQWYQAVRRSWRFGQQNTVTVDVISSEGEAGVLANMQRKDEQAQQMFAQLVSLMNNELKIASHKEPKQKEKVPSWL